MKKIILLAIAAVMGLGAAQAQFQFGAKVGFDMTHFWGKDLPHGMQPNYQAGLMMEYKFQGTRFAISPEVVFAAQGGKFKPLKDKLGIDLGKIGLGAVDKDVTYTTNYVNIPVMLKFYVLPAFSIDFGPQLGINVYSKTKVDGADKALDIKDNTKSVDFGLGLGGTYNLTENAFLQARYTMGMTNTFKGLTEDPDVKHGNIQVAFGYKF
mgnify:CR=1 FL=1